MMDTATSGSTCSHNKQDIVGGHLPTGDTISRILKKTKAGLFKRWEKTNSPVTDNNDNINELDSNANYDTDNTQEKQGSKQADRLYTMSEVSQHWSSESCWMVLHDNVYDITGFLREHPGGEDIMMENGGRDATVPFMDVGHSIDAHRSLEKYFIGRLHENERVIKKVRK